MESILRALILEGRISGRIDQVNQKLTLDRSVRHVNNKRYNALISWVESMEAIDNLVVGKTANAGNYSAADPRGLMGMA